MRNLHGAVIGVVFAAATLPSCDPQPGALGDPCHVLGAREATGITLEFPNIECSTRFCLYTPPELSASGTAPSTRPPDHGVCTESCYSDEECADASDGSCASGFACATPFTEGGFCCHRMCVCRDELDLLPGPQPYPAACDAADPRNTCENLPGRRR